MPEHDHTEILVTLKEIQVTLGNVLDEAKKTNSRVNHLEDSVVSLELTRAENVGNTKSSLRTAHWVMTTLVALIASIFTLTINKFFK